MNVSRVFGFILIGMGLITFLYGYYWEGLMFFVIGVGFASYHGLKKP